MKKTDAELILQNNNREEALKLLAKGIADWMMDTGLYRTCINCCDWSSPNETCMKFKQRPPAKVIVTGCEHHSDLPY